MDDQNIRFSGREYRRQTSPGAGVEPLPDGGLRLSIPAGPARSYRVAQIDDTHKLPRRDFNWQTPFALSLRAWVSEPDLPGTWGFGLWNDPFSASLGLAGTLRKLPAMPNTAWFFHASPENHLTLRDGLPGSGFLAAVFSSPLTPPLVLSPALIGLPLLAWRAAARMVRRAARSWIKESSITLELDPTLWHEYEIRAGDSGVRFSVDGQIVLESGVSPRGRLGLVIWIDNQYAAFTPQGQLHYAALENTTDAWLEIRDLAINSLV